VVINRMLKGVIITTAMGGMLAVAGCAGTRDSTAPVTPPPSVEAVPVATSLVANSPLSQEGWSGFPAFSGSSVKVLDQNGKGISGVGVAFRVSEGGGIVSYPTATTVDGYADAGWILGESSGANTIVASVTGLEPILFHADAKVPVIVQRYDLFSIGTDTLSVTNDGEYLHDGLTGARYVISADNTFAYFWDFKGVGRLGARGTGATVGPATLVFLLAQPDSSSVYGAALFATGALAGNMMTVTHANQNSSDSGLERYLLSSK
jgi:hypothetical protein